MFGRPNTAALFDLDGTLCATSNASAAMWLRARHTW